MSEIDGALNHIQNELLLSKIRESLEVDYEKARNAHDSIHEFMFLIGKLVPSSQDYSFKKHSAYLVYHWEIFDLSHRSYIDALSTYYNAAFILLRSTIELMIKGTFFECLAHKKYRENSLVLDSDERGKKIKNWINQLINYESSIANDLEHISGSIYDKIADFVLERDNVPSISKMLKQIINWGILDGIEEPYNLIYGNIYEKLSFNAHVLPDYIDIGRVLVSEKDLFQEREVMSNHLLEYFNMVHTIMDICMVASINILKENIQSFKEVKENIRERSMDKQFVSLGLKHTQKRIRELQN